METKYQKIKSIEIIKQDKYWVVVEFFNGTKWMPAIKDLAEILAKIGICEDKKYPNGMGHKYTKEFFNKVWNIRSKIELENLYKEFNPNNK